MYYPKIGLEIHIEVKTKTKMFCYCKNDPDEKIPNKNICPICLGYPGTLPLVNSEAIKKIIKLGIILNGKVSKNSYFERKHYFYPDLPKGYQISQYKEPLIKNAKLKLSNNKTIRIERIHIEEDTGKLLHFENYTLVDYNRAGIPLIELVTKPDIENSKEAFEFAKTLKEILIYNEISDADMEKGHMRLEANISLSKTKDGFGTKVEIKNLNSFKSLKDAIDFEIKRQTLLLKKNKKIIQETRGWNENLRKTISQRIKEQAQDYRYFPEPDIPPIEVNKSLIEELKKELKEPIEITKKRFKKDYNLSDKLIEAIFSNKKFKEIFVEKLEKTAKKDFKENYKYIIKKALNFSVSLILSLQTKLPIENSKINIKEILKIIKLLNEGKINNILAKEFMTENYLYGKSVKKFLKERNIKFLGKINIEKLSEEIINNNEKVVKDYIKGNKKALDFLIGQAMRLTKGQADPKKIKEILIKKIKK